MISPTENQYRSMGIGLRPDELKLAGVDTVILHKVNADPVKAIVTEGAVFVCKNGFYEFNVIKGDYFIIERDYHYQRKEDLEIMFILFGINGYRLFLVFRSQRSTIDLII